MKEKCTIIAFPSLGYKLNVIVSKDVNKSRYKRNDLLKSMMDEDSSVLGLFCSTSNFNGYIFLPYTANIETIAHESFHAICDMMNCIGTELDDKSEECYAYPLGYTCRLIKEFIDENYDYFNKKKKK